MLHRMGTFRRQQTADTAYQPSRCGYDRTALPLFPDSLCTVFQR